MPRRAAEDYEHGPPYAWNMKYYDWQTDYEIEDARRFVFGEWVKMKSYTNRHTFDLLEDIVGREVQAGFEGRSGGYFVIRDELTQEEYDRVTKHVETAMNGGIKEFLKDERDIRRQEEEEAAEQLREEKRELLADPKLGRILRQLHKHYGNHFTLMIRGIDVVQAHAELLTDPEKIL